MALCLIPLRRSVSLGQPLRPRQVVYRVMSLDKAWIATEDTQSGRTDVLAALLQCWQWTEVQMPGY